MNFKAIVVALAVASGLAILVSVAMLFRREKAATTHDVRGTGHIDVVAGGAADRPPRASEIPSTPAEGTVQHTSKGGRWNMAGGVIMEVTQNVYHGADVTSQAVLWWPSREDRPALRHEFWLASDAFGNREPWQMVWEANAATLWIALGEWSSRSALPEKPKLARIRRLDFSDPARIVETHAVSVFEVPEPVRTVLAEDFEIGETSNFSPGGPTIVSARLEHTWVVTGVTRNTAGEPLGSLPIALWLEDAVQPFDQLRSNPRGHFWTSIHPPLSALNSGCIIRVSANRINGIEPPADFQETRIELNAAEIARHVGTAVQAVNAAAFVGTIETPEGQPFSDALVAVIADGEVVSGFTTRADPKGKVHLTPIPVDRTVSVLVEASRWKRRGSQGGLRFAPATTSAAKLTLAHGRGFEWKLILNWSRPEDIEWAEAPNPASVSP